MVLNSYREEADSVLLPIAKKMRNVDPNHLSWLAFISAVLAGICFFLSSPIFIFTAVILILLNSFFDAMDGRIAKLTNSTSRQGDFLDHTLDRYSDIFILGGIAFSPLCRLSIGFIAVLGVIMTSYMGTQAHAVGVGRDYGGVAGRADRLILLILVPLIYLLLLNLYTVRFDIMGYTLTVFEFLMIWFAVAGHLTALHRGIASWGELEREEK